MLSESSSVCCSRFSAVDFGSWIIPNRNSFWDWKWFFFCFSHWCLVCLCTNVCLAKQKKKKLIPAMEMKKNETLKQFQNIKRPTFKKKKKRYLDFDSLDWISETLPQEISLFTLAKFQLFPAWLIVWTERALVSLRVFYTTPNGTEQGSVFQGHLWLQGLLTVGLWQPVVRLVSDRRVSVGLVSNNLNRHLSIPAHRLRRCCLVLGAWFSNFIIKGSTTYNQSLGGEWEEGWHFFEDNTDILMHPLLFAGQ